MIGISKLLCGSETFGDRLRYSHASKDQVHGTMEGHGPVVVWNMTRTCNLKCIHCYSDSEYKQYQGELTTEEARRFVDDLAEFRVPVILLSGGEPFLREDFFELIGYAARRGLRVTISTNGTLINKEVARRVKELGVSYVGISLDGIGETNDRFRGKTGAFESALRGIRNCLEIGQKVGLRFTINAHNYRDLDDIFHLVEEEGIPRVCFYHLVYTGRGGELMKDDLTHHQTREALELIIRRTLEFHARGLEKEILTVDNHADGVYLYLKVLEKDPDSAADILQHLRRNGGNRSGIAIGQVDHQGDVHADQFSQGHKFGNVRETPFSKIWTEARHPILAGLRNRKPLLKGRCAACHWLDVCNGNFRARAEAATGDFWESDPACYLTDEEIGLVASKAGQALRATLGKR